MSEYETAKFCWPCETILTNDKQETLKIKPLTYNFHGLQQADDERAKECYRYYATPNGILTEMELKYWKIGGEDKGHEIVVAATKFLEEMKNSVPIDQLLKHMIQSGFSEPQIAITLDWLIKGEYVVLDAEQWLISTKE